MANPNPHNTNPVPAPTHRVVGNVVHPTTQDVSSPPNSDET